MLEDATLKTMNYFLLLKSLEPIFIFKNPFCSHQSRLTRVPAMNDKSLPRSSPRHHNAAFKEPPAQIRGEKNYSLNGNQRKCAVSGHTIQYYFISTVSWALTMDHSLCLRTQPSACRPPRQNRIALIFNDTCFRAERARGMAGDRRWLVWHCNIIIGVMDCQIESVRGWARGRFMEIEEQRVVLRPLGYWSATAVAVDTE